MGSCQSILGAPHARAERFVFPSRAATSAARSWADGRRADVERDLRRCGSLASPDRYGQAGGNAGQARSATFLDRTRPIYVELLHA